MRLAFTVPGKPVPQGAVRTFIAGGRAHGRHSNAKELQDYRARIAMAAQEVMGEREPIDGPVEIDVGFYIARPQSHFGTGRNVGSLKASAPLFPTTRPDLSHLVRALEDGLSGVVIRDDAVIVSINAAKAYDARPRTEVFVELLTRTIGSADMEAAHG